MSVSAPAITERTARMALACVARPYDPEVARLVAERGPVEGWLRLMQLDTGAGHKARHLDIDAVLVAAERAGARFVVPGDEEWPVALDELDAPHLGGPWAPLGLWLAGESLLAANEPVAITGSRASTAYGDNVAREMAAELAERGHSVVTTSSYGIPTAALRGVLAAGGNAVVVLPSGIDAVYPRASESLVATAKERGTVVAEQAPGTPPSRAGFLASARLLAALGRGTVVVEAALRSNASWSATWAENLGRGLFAVPGPVTSTTSQLPHQLIRDGRARLVTSAHDVLVDCTAITTEEN